MCEAHVRALLLEVLFGGLLAPHGARGCLEYLGPCSIAAAYTAGLPLLAVATSSSSSRETSDDHRRRRRAATQYYNTVAALSSVLSAQHTTATTASKLQAHHSSLDSKAGAS